MKTIIVIVKWVIFAGFYFRYIHNLLMECKFNTPQLVAKLYYTYCECLTHNTYKWSDNEFKTPRKI